MSTNPAPLPDSPGAGDESAQSRRLWDVALGVASSGHDLNNWLTLAFSNLELAQMGIGRPVEELELCRDALRGAIELLQMALRDSSNSEGSCDIATAIDGVLRLGRSLWARRAIVERDVLPLPKAAIPQRDVQRVLLNLVLNAVAAVPEGGKILVRARSVGDTVVIEVRDNGPGFPQELLDVDLQPFTSTRAAGSGLGLAGSALLARRVGGALAIASNLEGGAIVRLTVPAVVKTQCG